jgi:broad specificity polyphosphatase/5'/3'-nucleotidase SurE
MIIKQLQPKFNSGNFFSVNLPDDLSSPKIIFASKLQKLRYKTNITKRFDPNGTPYFWVTGSNGTIEKGTELYEIAVNKNITVNEIPVSNLG